MFKKVVYDLDTRLSINYDDMRHSKFWITDENHFSYDCYSIIDFVDAFNEEQFIDDETDRYKIFLDKDVAKDYIENRELKADTERKQHVN